MITEESIRELAEFFNGRELPKVHIALSSFETITDAGKMVDSHLSICINNKGKQPFEPYQNRLIKLKNILENEN